MNFAVLICIALRAMTFSGLRLARYALSFGGLSACLPAMHYLWAGAPG
jgi:hypothetical protein